jgi:hypothetical protein
MPIDGRWAPFVTDLEEDAVSSHCAGWMRLSRKAGGAGLHDDADIESLISSLESPFDVVT